MIPQFGRPDGSGECPDSAVWRGSVPGNKRVVPLWVRVILQVQAAHQDHPDSVGITGTVLYCAGNIDARIEEEGRGGEGRDVRCGTEKHKGRTKKYRQR